MLYPQLTPQTSDRQNWAGPSQEPGTHRRSPTWWLGRNRGVHHLGPLLLVLLLLKRIWLSLQLLKTVTFTVISIMTHSNGLNKLTLNSETFTIKFLWNKIPSCKFYSNIPELGNQVHIPNSKHGAEELMVRPQKASPFHSVRFHAKTA